MTGSEPARLRPLPPLIFLDIEASALLGGYPIEIAWVDALGHGESQLIRPADEWLRPDGRFLWSEASQRIHGITPNVLRLAGGSHLRIARRAVDVLGRTGAVVLSDNPEMDGRWLDVLLDAAGIERRIGVSIVDAAYRDAVLPLLRLSPPGARTGGGAFWRHAEEANRILLDIEHRFGLQVREHRALPDALRMWRQWRAIRIQVARRVAEERRR